MKSHFLEFVMFLKKQKVLSISIAFIIASQAKSIMKGFTDDFIIPLSKKITEPNKNHKLKKIYWTKYFLQILTLMIVAYVLFIISKTFGLIELSEKPVSVKIF